MAEAISGTWDVALDESKAHLKVHYVVRNASSDTVYVSDELLRSGGNGLTSAGDAILVVNGDEAGTVRLVRAAIGSERPLAALYPTTYVPLAPGEKLERTAIAPWPLVAWHNLGYASPLKSKPTRAVLELHYFVGEPPEWRDLPGADGKAIRVPEQMTPQPFRMGPIDLPAR